MTEFLESFPVWLQALITVVTACTAITAITPSQTDNKYIQILLDFLNLLAGNVGKNKNADAEDRS